MTLPAVHRLVPSLAAALLAAAAPPAFADEDAAEEGPSAGASAADVSDDGYDLSPEEQMQEMREKLRDVERQLRQSQEVSFKPRTTVEVTGYADLGFFVPQGDGAGYIQDFGNHYFPEYSGRFGWVFLGDILAPTVNSRGEAADLGPAPGVNRFDSVHSRGAISFLVNEVSLGVRVGLQRELLLTTSVDFVPRSGADFGLGDFFDVNTAQLEYIPDFLGGTTSFFIGKFDPVIGIEYKERKANRRFGITPSLIERYTSGSPIGVKARTKLFDETLILALALTNGTSGTEQFHFAEEVDSNNAKTASSRVALRLHLWGSELELGGSAMYGSQDHARANNQMTWFLGADLQFSLGGFALKGQWLRGISPGNDADRAYGLTLRSGAYVEGNMMITPIFGVLARAELRDAFVWLTDERAYLTKSWRGTLGLRAVLSENVVIKAEYLRNGEYAGIPEVPNDVFTSSVLLIY
jgi:hypothetical protein